jgi:hypothetical protein
MERVAIVAGLKPGASEQARRLVASGPPFDLKANGVERHSVFVSAAEVIFLFEGHEIEWAVDSLVDDPFQYDLQQAFDAWRAIVDGTPRVAQEQFEWHGDGDDAAFAGRTWAK